MRNLPILIAAALALASPVAGQAPTLDGARILKDVEGLASDAFEGRGPATAGETKTVDYLIAQMKGAGLAPAGDPLPGGGRAWTQDVPLNRYAITGPVKIGVVAGRPMTWTQGEEVALRPSQAGGGRMSVKDAPLVFLGYGVSAPERRWDDFKGVDLKGKIGLVLVNDPDFETGRGDFGGKAMTYYGRWTYKFEEAARRGAIGFMVIHETAPAAYGWPTVKNSNLIEAFDVVRDDPAKAHAPLEGWIQRDAAAGLIKAAGLDFETLKVQARGRDFRPVELRGVTFSADYQTTATRVVTKNVLGAVAGAARPDERVFYTAHWDHLGVGPADARGDRIYNGAIDNGTGVAVMLELARAFAKGPKPQRSVVFLSVGAEEKGLLGSEYYATHPLYPLATTVGVLNMDALAPTAAARNFTTSGDAPLTLQDDLIAAGARLKRTFAPDPRPEAGLFFRSDHFSFAKQGVPAISYLSGDDLIEGGKAGGLAFAEHYYADLYHQPADQYSSTWRADGLVADAQILLALGRDLADSRVWPEWKPGAEFKALRDRTKAARR